MLKNYYIYMYLDADSVPFYIGMGCGQRYLVCRHIRNKDQQFLKNKILKIGKENVKIHFLHKYLTREEALNWETYWISYLGRRCDGSGQLVNLMVTYDGVTKHSKLSKNKMSIAHTDKKLSKETKLKVSKNNSRYWNGKKRPQETIQKMSDSAKGKFSGENNGNSKLTWEKIKEIRKLHNPKNFSTRKLARIYNVSQHTIVNIINNKTWAVPNKR